MERKNLGPELLELAFEAAPLPLLVLHTNGAVLGMNRAAEALFSQIREVIGANKNESLSAKLLALAQVHVVPPQSSLPEFNEVESPTLTVAGKEWKVLIRPFRCQGEGLKVIALEPKGEVMEKMAAR